MITGVSRGLGAALFDEFCRADDRVLALGRRFSDSQHAVQRAEPHRIRLRQTDLASPRSLPDGAELARFADEANEVVLIHNAAVIEPFGAVGSLSPDQLTHAVAVNLTSPMLLTNALLGPGTGDRLVAGAVARVTILFVSSAAAHRVSGGRSVYSATKRGGEMFFEALAAQHAGDPAFYVAIVDPGIMDTDMQAVIRRYAVSGAYFPDRDRFLQRHERGMLPSPGTVAQKIIAEHVMR